MVGTAGIKGTRAYNETQLHNVTERSPGYPGEVLAQPCTMDRFPGAPILCQAWTSTWKVLMVTISARPHYVLALLCSLIQSSITQGGQQPYVYFRAEKTG